MTPNDLLAVGGSPIGPALNGLGTIGDAGADPTTFIAQIISAAIGILTVIAAIYFMFNLITGAIGIISSGGDKGAYEDARKKITSGFIGLVVTISAIFIMGLVAILLDIPDILNIDQILTF